MRNGLAPQQTNIRTGKLESMELHHIIPQRENGPNTYNNLMRVWPDQHAEIDSYRHIGGIKWLIFLICLWNRKGNRLNMVKEHSCL